MYDTTDDVSPAEMLTEDVVLDCRDVDRGAIIPRDRIAATVESVSLEPDDFVILDTPMDRPRQFPSNCTSTSTHSRQWRPHGPCSIWVCR